jgi:hypothetical protein
MQPPSPATAIAATINFFIFAPPEVCLILKAVTGEPERECAEKM